MITLRYESAAQLVNVLRPLITPNNTIAAFPGSNALVITDYADNLRRIERIIASLDQPPGGEPIARAAAARVGARHRADAEPAARRTRGAPARAVDAQQRVTIVADPRSNSVLVRADNPGRARARAAADRAARHAGPRRAATCSSSTCKNAEAARVAQTLRALLTGSDARTRAPRRAAVADAAGMFLGNAPTARRRADRRRSALPLRERAGRRRRASRASGATIPADTANNALVIMAPEPVYNNLRAIIEKLDVRRAQVYVEALIVEVSADKAAEFGIQWQALTGLQHDADARDRRHQLRAARQRHQHHRHRRRTRGAAARASTSA